MFLRKLRAMLVPLVLLLVVVLCFGWDAPLPGGASASFLWNVLLGALLGCALCLLPTLTGSGARERFAAQRWLACVLLALVLLYQYGAAHWGVRIPFLQWMLAENARVLFAEGCVLGCALVTAIRAKR